jgi:hypothetical protein
LKQNTLNTFLLPVGEEIFILNYWFKLGLNLECCALAQLSSGAA